jgi:hypothetical protein
MKFILTIFIAIFLSGCMSDSKQFISTNNNNNIDRVERVYVSVPRDGVYGNINYGGSGKNVSRIITMAFSKYNGIVESASRYQSFKEAILYAKNNKYNYLVFPTILEWEDRATEWSGISDRVSIKIAVFNVKTEKRLSSAIVKGKSGWATFGGDHPQDLLPEPVEQYTDSLFL